MRAVGVRVDCEDDDGETRLSRVGRQIVIGPEGVKLPSAFSFVGGCNSQTNLGSRQLLEFWHWNTHPVCGCHIEWKFPTINYDG